MTKDLRTKPVLCNVCRSDAARPLWTALDRLHGFEGSFQYVQCLNCGLVYMNPQIAPELIGQFYPADYAPHQVGSAAQDKTGARPDLPRMILNSLHSDSRVLDVGCGNGAFLNQLREFCHCRVYGIDISENAVLCAKKQYGLEVFQGNILSAPFKPNSFDLIAAWSCIEHLHNPKAAIKRAFDLCKPAGWLFIKTPNYNSLAAKLFRDKWYHLDCPRHLYIFSPSTIKALLEKCGFEVIKIRYEPSSKGWLGSLQYVFYGDNHQSRTKNKIRRSRLVKSVVSPVSYLSSWLRKADVMSIVARRKIN